MGNQHLKRDTDISEKVASGFYGTRRNQQRSTTGQMDAISAISTITNLDDFELNNGSESESEHIQLQDSENSDPDNFSFTSSQHSGMYAFEGSVPAVTPHQSRIQAAATPLLDRSSGKFRTPSVTNIDGNSNPCSTPTSRCSVPLQCDPATPIVIHRREENYRVADLLEKQNQLILDLISKQESLSSSIREVKSDLKETKVTIKKLSEVNEKQNEQSEKMKRKYPSSLTVIYHCFPSLQWYNGTLFQERLAKIHEASDKKLDPTLR